MKLLVEESEFIYCDVHDIVRYLRKQNPAVAARFVHSFQSTVDLLKRVAGDWQTTFRLGCINLQGEIEQIERE